MRRPLASKLIPELSARFVETWGGMLCHDVRPKGDGKCPDWGGGTPHPGLHSLDRPARAEADASVRQSQPAAE